MSITSQITGAHREHCKRYKNCGILLCMCYRYLNMHSCQTECTLLTQILNMKNTGQTSICFSSYLKCGGMISTSESNLSIGGDDTSSFAWFLLLDPLVLETGLLLSSGIVSNLSLLYARSSFHVHLKHTNMSHSQLIFVSDVRT